MSNAYNVQAPGDAVTSVLKYNAVTAALGRITDLSLSPVQPFDFVVFKVGATYYRRNGETGIVDDDNAAFHTLMNDLLAANISVGIMPGSYAQTAAITAMDDYSSVFGFPGTIISPTGNINVFTVDGSNADKIVYPRISGITFNGPADTSTARALWTDFVDDLLFDHNIVTGFDGAATAAVYLRDSYRARIQGDTFRSGTRGIELIQNDNVNRPTGSDYALIVDDMFEGLTNHAIKIDESDNPNISSSTFTDCGASGVAVIDGSTSILNAKLDVAMASCDGGGINLPCSFSDIHAKLTLVGIANNDEGIYVDGTENRISGNISKCYGHGVRLNGSDNLVDNCLIYAPGWIDGSGLHDGIYLGANVDNTKIGSGVKILSETGKFMRYGINMTAATCNDTHIGDVQIYANGGTVTLLISDAGTTTKFPVNPDNWFSHMDLSGGAVDHEVYTAVVPCFLAGYRILYTEASSGDAGVNVRVGRTQDGVANDDDYFDVSVSEINENLGYHLDVLTASLTQETIAAGDMVTVGTAGGKAGLGEVVVILKIVETG